MKLKLLLAGLALAIGSFFVSPTATVQAAPVSTLEAIQTDAAPLEMRGRRGWGGHRGFRRHYAVRRHHGYRRAYRPHRVHYFAPPPRCRVVIRYDAWGYAHRVRRCW